MIPYIDIEATAYTLRQARLECGLRVQDVQRYFGFETPQAIYKWEQAKALPCLDNLMAICELYGKKVEELIILDEMQRLPR